MDQLANNIQQVRERIRRAAERAGRPAGDIVLLAVTKAVEPYRIEQALAAGVTAFGENKVQEAKQKMPLVSGRAHWQFLGHLQGNKARDAVELFELIHSVDSVKLAAELNKWAERAGKTQPILLEINVAGEASKFGLKPADLLNALDGISKFPRLEVRGLMTIPPSLEDLKKVRPYFRHLRELRDTLGLRELSMGMSHDFEAAIEEGATIVRIGTAIFGERKQYEPEE